MAFTLENVAALRAGWLDPIVLGDLPYIVAIHMRLRVTKAYLSKDSLEHINTEHPDITDIDLLIVADAIRHGWFMQEKAKRRFFLCWYTDRYTGQKYAAVFKVAMPDREAYLVSFRKGRKHQTRAWQERCITIKTHS
jgi:hypothetical protein